MGTFFRLIILAVMLIGAAGVLSAQELASYTSPDFELRAAQSPEGSLALVINSKKPFSAEIFDIPDPSRIVLDLSGLKVAKGLSLPLKSTGQLKALRLGAHLNKLRVVLDFGRTDLPAYSHTIAPDRLDLKIESKADSPAPRPLEAQTPPAPQSSATPTRLPQDSPTPAASPTWTPETSLPPSAAPGPQLPALIESPPVYTATVHAPAAATMAAPVMPTPSPSAPVVPELRELTSLNFELIDRQPVLKATLSRAVEFSLMRRDDRTFVIEVSDCAMSKKHLALPVFPTQEFKGFSYTLARQEGRSLSILVGVDPGRKLSALTRKNEIWISSVKQ